MIVIKDNFLIKQNTLENSINKNKDKLLYNNEDYKDNNIKIKKKISLKLITNISQKNLLKF